MEFSFFHPLRLACLLPLLALVGFCWLRSSRPQRHLIAAVQSLLAVALCAALANIVSSSIEATSLPGSRVFAQDASQSMSQDATKNVDAEAARYVTFKGDAMATEAPSDAQALKAGSDPALGVVVGSGQGASLVVLDSDGRETNGNLLAAASRLDQPLFVLSPNAHDEMRIVSAHAVPHRPDRMIELHVIVESNVKARATLQIRLDGAVHRQELAAQPGRNSIQVSLPAGGRRKATLDLELQSDADRDDRNNRYVAEWLALAPVQVAVVHNAPNQLKPLQAKLAAMGLDATPWSRDKITAENLANVEALVLLSESSALDAQQQATIEKYVALGGGVVVVGGQDTYGRSTLESSTWKEWLPVSPSAEKTRITRESFAMVLIIDKSESMQYENRLTMAKQAASQTVQLLDPEDQVGVLAFGTNSDWVSEIAPSGDKQDLLARIGSLKVEGETNLYPAIERAQLALEQVEADHKHLILLTDGVSSPGDFAEISANLKASEISVATVSVSSGAEQLMLKDIARIADGKHYHCEDANQLPNVLVRAAQQAVRGIAPTRFSTFELEGGLHEVPMETAPELTGVVVTSPKEDTVLAYLTDDGQPLIVWRKHEQGVAASVVCDSASLLGAEWSRWSGFTAFWKTLLSKVERETPTDEFHVQGFDLGDAFELQVNFTSAGEWDSAAELEVRAAGAAQPDQMSLVGPGLYRARFPKQAGQQTISGELMLRSGDAVWQRPWTIHQNYADEFQHVGANADLLRSAASASGGGMIESLDEIPAEALAARVAKTPRFRPLWIAFLAAGVLLLLAETLIRRWSRRFGAI